jgi:adenosylhomocysteine nucleosidase
MKYPAIILLLFLFLSAIEINGQKVKYSVIISADTEWKMVKKRYPSETFKISPWGEYFFRRVNSKSKSIKVLFFHEGWGKVSAAGATQYVIDKFNPEIMINLGTCGGFEGDINQFETILADKTIIYDIKEAMGDSKEAISDYSTEIDLSWLGSEDYPVKVKRSLLVSADRDLVPDELASLRSEYNAVAGDWETGAIAYVCKRNNIKTLILRGVTDLVSSDKGEAYNNFSLFEQRTEMVMMRLLDQLPLWLEFIESKNRSL